jgi:hypothetical protein
MKKPHRPLAISLALCGALLVTTGGAHAQAAPSPAQVAARHKQMCEDGYAHQVGDLAYLEAKLALTAAQQPLFDRWKSVKLEIAKRGEADCATRELPSRAQGGPTLLDAMAREEEDLKRRLADLDAERPALAALYNVLTAGQKTALLYPGPEAMMARHRMMANALAPNMAPNMTRRSRAANRPPMPDAPPPSQ